MVEDIDILEDLDVSKKDQLDYKNTLRFLVTRYLLNKETYDVKPCVKSLLSSIDFNIEGLPFRTKLEGYVDSLNVEKENRVKEYYSSGPRWKVYSRSNQAKFKIETHRWYWNSIGDFVIDLLAQHDALIKSKKRVETGFQKGDIHTL